MDNRKYNQNIEILKKQKEPLVYNEKGEVKRVFFIKDTLCQHTPYTLVLGQNPESILWDRYNIGLPIQFYTHEAAFGKINKYSDKSFAMFFESEVIRRLDFDMALSNSDLMRRFNKIFTFSELLLEKYENAVFTPACGLWYGTDENDGSLDELRYKKKTKNISVIASNKQSTECHKLRIKLANDAIRTGKVDGYGLFCGNRLEKKADALSEYRYSIVVENDVKPFYFTEKILDCFASMTIPIYVGATKIDQFFNMDGIITIKEKEYDNIDHIISVCTKQDYENRINAIKDNFERVKKYRCIEDYIMNNYSDLF